MGFSKMMELLQEKNKGKIVICSNGGFYIAVGKDAVMLHELLDLKVSCFKPEICKIGFPIKRKIKDKDLLWLLEEILFAQKREKGLEIGNYTSQMFANIYLNEIDQYIKHQLKIKYYCRYLDDSLLIVKTKKEAKEALEKIKIFLKKNLRFRVKQKNTNI